MEKVHISRYSIHLDSTKIYCDLREFYWWEGMKKGIAEFVINCPNCQQVKVEHEMPGGLSQTIKLLERKWEMSNMDSSQDFQGLAGSMIRFGVYRDRSSSPSYGEGESDSREIENGTDSPKAYIDVRGRPLKFKVNDWVYLKASPMKGIMWFGKKGKLNPWYIGSYRISKRVGNVAYELKLPQELVAVHPVFHISMLKKCLGDPSLIVPTENVGIKDSLSYEEIQYQILDRKVRKLRTKEVASVKVLWGNQFVEEATLEVEKDMNKRYPHPLESGEIADQVQNSLLSTL
ncbi:uncharacterized protein [Solanum lycopersicum]|uniref:uncharacterized protein n=1 Tax=Solanum lycopersicum TaxID=4081 RepID=UPI0037498AB6